MVMDNTHGMEMSVDGKLKLFASPSNSFNFIL